METRSGRSVRARIGRLAAGALGMALCATPAFGQAAGAGGADWRQAQARSIEGMKEKFVQLSEAFPEDLYGWRPEDGVRSVREVFTLIAAGAATLPAGWGFEPLAGAEATFPAESRRVATLSPVELGRRLDESLTYYGSLVGELGEDAMRRRATLGGNEVTASDALLLLADDFHEHLGQLIAYARVNHIVPPWSRSGM